MNENETTKQNQEAVKPATKTETNSKNNKNKRPYRQHGQENSNKRKVPTTGFGWENDLIKAFDKNEQIQKNRLDPNTRINLKSNSKVRITPLGGLGEIGGNMMIIETDKSAVIIDVGMSFPDDTMHGVDILIPDFSYLRTIRHKVSGILITHGHEDHIGAMPYLFKEMQFPIYGTSLPLEMIGSKFDEHRIREHKSYFRAIEKRKPIKIGDFEVEWMHITHSIVDCSALAIKCDAGTIIHTGDFKIDHTPIDNYPTDFHRLAYYGEKGILALLSDSTNSHSAGFTKSEKTVGPTFDRIFNNAKGRVLMSTFSSNIHRVSQAIEHGIKYGRKVCVIGRSMEKNLDIAMRLGYVKFPKDIFIDAHHVKKYRDNEILIVTTGSQGEPMSALFRMSIHEHRHIKIKPEDQIILSARAIPGNEAGVSQIINHLQKAGATVAYQDYTDIHVSGHAGQEEQKLMIRICKPKFFLPIHGEYNHALRHGKTGVSCGVEERNVYVMSDGEQIEITPKSLKKVKSVKTGKVYIDNQKNNKIANDVVIDRQTMANDGMVVIVAQISQDERKLVSPAKIMTFGLASGKAQGFLIKELEEVLAHYLDNVKPGILQNNKAVEDELRTVIRKHCVRKLQKYPMIVPTLIVQ
ncbi:MAG: ribonuclease J [Campylobacteraceae bacterium 4484_166]|nr:MAG: ribonuclease J [Campylobacteraceae bacterium 4484_166]